DDVIDGRADGLGEAAIVERRRNSVVLARECEHELVEPLRRDARLDVLGQHVERARGKLAGSLHALEGIAAVKPDLGVARLGAVDVEVVHETPRTTKRW